MASQVMVPIMAVVRKTAQKDLSLIVIYSLSGNGKAQRSTLWRKLDSKDSDIVYIDGSHVGSINARHHNLQR